MAASSLSARDERSNLQLPVAAVLVALAYWQTWVTFPPAWIIGRQHGFAVAAFSLWLLWRARAGILTAGPSFVLASVPIAGISVLWMIGYVLNVQVVHQAAVPLLLALWLLAVRGVSSFRHALPAVIVYFLAVPLWGLLNLPLQRLTVLANGLMLKLTSVSAVIEDEYIAIPAGVFEVAQGCSGLNYLESALFISVVYAMLFLRAWQARTAAVVLAAALALISNWIRVFGLVLIGQYTNMQSSLIKEHNLYGWLIFAAAILLYFVLVKRLERWDDRLEATERKGETGEARHESGSSSPWPVFSRDVVPPTLAALIGPVAFLFLASTPNTEAPETLEGSVVPGVEWREVESREMTLAEAAASSSDHWRPAYIGADEYRTQLWRSESDAVRLHRFIYVQQRQGKELIGNDNRIAHDSLVLGGGTVGPLDETGRQVKATIVRNADRHLLVWYWYRVAGYDVHSGVDAKLLELVAFVTGGAPSELVAVSTECSPPDEQCEQATRRLYRFVLGKAPPDGR